MSNKLNIKSNDQSWVGTSIISFLGTETTILFVGKFTVLLTNNFHEYSVSIDKVNKEFRLYNVKRNSNPTPTETFITIKPLDQSWVGKKIIIRDWIGTDYYIPTYVGSTCMVVVDKLGVESDRYFSSKEEAEKRYARAEVVLWPHGEPIEVAE